MPSKELIPLFDEIAMSATAEDILRHRGAYANPAGGQKVFYRHSIEKARYLFAAEMMKVRAEVLAASALGEKSE